MTPSDLVSIFGIGAKIRTPLEVQWSLSSSSFAPTPPLPSPGYRLLSTVYLLQYTVYCLQYTAKSSQVQPRLRSEVY